MDIVRDPWDDIPDDELEETIWERFIGLGEMFPVRLRKFANKSAELSVSLVQNAWWVARNGVWIGSTSFAIMALPYVIVKEMSDLQKAQVAQQRQMLLGPAAAVQAAKHQ